MKKAIKQHESLRVQLQAPSDEEEEVVSEDETSAETTQGDGTNGYHVFVQEPMRDVPGRSPHSNLVDVHSMVEHRWTSLPVRALLSPRDILLGRLTCLLGCRKTALCQL